MFHKARGHNTAECLPLRNSIEDLIQQGHLKEFVKRPHGTTWKQDTSPGGSRAEASATVRITPTKKRTSQQLDPIPMTSPHARNTVQKQGVGHPLQYEKRYQHYTPLIHSVARIFSLVKDDVPFQRPLPIRETARNRSSNRFCNYHKAKGHNTE